MAQVCCGGSCLNMTFRPVSVRDCARRARNLSVPAGSVRAEPAVPAPLLPSSSKAGAPFECGLLSARPMVAVRPRRDAPVVQPPAQCSWAVALQVLACPAGRGRAVTALRRDFLAASSVGPYRSQLNTWEHFHRAAFGSIPVWPLTVESVTAVAAGFQVWWIPLISELS